MLLTNDLMKKFRSISRSALVVGALATTIGWAGSRPAHAQTATIGVVDGVKINDGYTKLKTALDDIDKHKQDLRSQLDARAFLNATDAARFDVLIVKDKPTDAEKAEVLKLVTTGSSRRTEYNGLIGKAVRSDDDKKRIKELEDDAQKSGATFQNVVDQVDQSVTKQETDAEDDYRGRILKVVEQVAGEKKLVLVVGKQAIAWNSSTIDITDEVLTRLNKA